jgi:hypothetical protein
MQRELDDDGGKEARKHIPKFADRVRGGVMCVGTTDELNYREMKSLDNGPVA